MWARRKAAILARRKERFAAPFYANHRADLELVTGCGIAAVIATGAVAFITLAHALLGRDAPGLPTWDALARAGVAAALFLAALWGLVAGFRDQLTLRVLPYFERPVGAIDTWLAGEALLWHSQALDAAALRCGATPLSGFASGDDLIRGQELRWFDTTDALRTAECLLEPDMAGAFPEGVVNDLGRLRDALRRAHEQGTRFCLLVREGSYTSGHEMSVRKGSFF